MSRDSLSLYVTRGKRYFGIALAVALLGLATARAPGQEDPPVDMVAQAASAAEDAYKLVNKNKLDEARQAYAKIVTDYQQTDYAIEAKKGIAICDIKLGDIPAAQAVVAEIITDFRDHQDIATVLNLSLIHI